MKTAAVRPARPADFEAVKELTRQLFFYEQPQLNPNLNAAWVDSAEAALIFQDNVHGRENRQAFVAETGGRVIAMLTASVAIKGYLLHNPTAEIDTMFVEPDYRGSGVGAQLVDAFKGWAKDRGATQLRVMAWTKNQAALRFYRRHGFQDAATTLEQPVL